MADKLERSMIENLKLYALEIHSRISLGNYTVMRVPGGWLYSENYAGSSPVFVPVPKVTKAEEMHEALINILAWRGIGRDANDQFEDIGAIFQKDTGWLRPGKSEPPEMYYEGREEERRKIWDEWVKKKNQELDELIISALNFETTN